jgi:hypothetical protein
MITHKEVPDFANGAAILQGDLPENEFSYSDLSLEWRRELLDPEGWRQGSRDVAGAMRLAVALTDPSGRLLGKCHNPQPTWRLARGAKAGG